MKTRRAYAHINTDTGSRTMAMISTRLSVPCMQAWHEQCSQQHAFEALGFRLIHVETPLGNKIELSLPMQAGSSVGRCLRYSVAVNGGPYPG